MRKRKAKIGSFGALKGRDMEFSEGMTVIHGPNESGKTTTMEFIRCCIVPTKNRGKNVYPVRSRSDSGSLEYEEDGEPKEVLYNDKKLSGDVYPMPNGTGDPELYRSVFAMNAGDLDDDGSVSKLKSRFLTVPGGERVPKAMESCEKRWDSVLGKALRSKSSVRELDAEIESIGKEIAAAKATVDRYGELSSRLESLNAETARIRSEFEESSDDRKKRTTFESMAENYRKLSDLEANLTALGTYRKVTEEDKKTLESLNSDVISKKDALDRYTKKYDDCKKGLMGADLRAVDRCHRRIDSVLKDEGVYRDRLRTLSQPKAPAEPRKQTVKKEVRKTNPLVFLGLIVIVAGIAAALVNPILSVIAVAGAAMAVVGFMKPKVEVTYEEVEQTASFTPILDNERQYVEHYESEVSGLMRDLGLISRGVDADLELLREISKRADDLTDLENEESASRLAYSEAQRKLAEFYSLFGGEEGYGICVNKTNAASELAFSIKMVRGTIVSAGLDPDVRTCPVTGEVPDDISGKLNEIGVDVGRIEQEMKSIAGDKGIERLMDERESKRAEMKRLLDEGAVALLASTLAEDACLEVHTSLQPGVSATASRYLSMMTDGRYEIDLNPMEEALSIKGDGSSKPMGQWSSGLRAQTLLSLKLAIAKEMGEGKVPVILDDVLLPFDSERKAGACRALREVSDEMQVILFTCDRETKEICEGIDGITVQSM